jgi:hypothetical protein
VVTATLPRWREEGDFVLMERDIVVTVGGSASQGRIENDSRHLSAAGSDGLN